MIPLDRLRKMASSMDPDLHVCASELLRIREMAAEMPDAAGIKAVFLTHPEKRRGVQWIRLRDAAWAARRVEVLERYCAAVAESVALIAQVAELKEECARLRDEYAKHCQAFAHPALSRGAKS